MPGIILRMPMPTADTTTLSDAQADAKGLWQRIDLAVLRYLHGLRIPAILHWPLIVFVRIGDGWIWVGIAAWLYAILPWLAFRRTVVECLLAVGISLVLYWPIKLLTRRARPYAAHDWVTRKVPPLDKYSFPSGHTMNNLAVSLTLASQMPALYVPAIGIPLILGLLRIVFGVHFLTDIGAGALLGLISHFAAKATMAGFSL
jgi:undecaprenyl-diphosphatase